MGNLLIYSAADEFYNWPRALPRCWRCHGSLGRKPKLGFDPATFGGHSLRAGFVTSAVKRGANLIKITDVTGHKSLDMLKTYSRDAHSSVTPAQDCSENDAYRHMQRSGVSRLKLLGRHCSKAETAAQGRSQRRGQRLACARTPR